MWGLGGLSRLTGGAVQREARRSGDGADAAEPDAAAGGAAEGDAPQDQRMTGEQSRQMLLDMGFDETQVDRALRECGGVASEAALYLLSVPADEGDEDDEAAAATDLIGVDAAAALVHDIDDDADATLAEVLRISEEVSSAEQELQRAIRLSQETWEEDEQRRRVKPVEYKMDAQEVALQEGMQQLRTRAAASPTAAVSSSQPFPGTGAARSSSSSSQPLGSSTNGGGLDIRPASRRVPFSPLAEDALHGGHGVAEKSSTASTSGGTGASPEVPNGRSESRGSLSSGADLMRVPRSRSLAAMGFDAPSRPESVGSGVGLDDLDYWNGEPESGRRGVFGGGRNLGSRGGDRPHSSMAGLHAALTRAGVGAPPGSSGGGPPFLPPEAGGFLGGFPTPSRSKVAPLIPINQAVGLTPNGALIASGQRPMMRQSRQRPESNAGLRRPIGGTMQASSSTSSLRAAASATLQPR